MSSKNPAPRPFSVTLVMVLTWIIAIFTILGGLLFLLADAATLAEAGMTKSAANTYGIVEIVLGLIIALVAKGLGSGNNFSRLLVTMLMLLRVGVAVWVAVQLWGYAGFWAVVIAGLVSLLVLIMLWSAKANAFFATN